MTCADICFCIDASRSMGRCFPAVRDRVEGLLGAGATGIAPQMVLLLEPYIRSYSDAHTPPEE